MPVLAIGLKMFRCYVSILKDCAQATDTCVHACNLNHSYRQWRIQNLLKKGPISSSSRSFFSSPSSSFLLKNRERLRGGSMIFLGLGAPAPLDRPPSAASAPGYRLPAMSGRSVLCLVHGRVIVDSCTLTGRLKKV